jgi:hypothetical protein
MNPLRTLFGLLLAAALAGAAHAGPPDTVGPLSDGRELEPVARDYYLPAPATERPPDRVPARTAGRRGDTVGGVLAALAEALRHGPVR